MAHSGDDDAAELVTLLYEELKVIAHSAVDRLGPHEPLSPTDLVGEAYVRLSKQRNIDRDKRTEFFAIATNIIRHTLVDLERASRRQKRGGGWRRVTLSAGLLSPNDDGLTTLDLDDAINQLQRYDMRQARIVELRFFGGLSTDEIANHLNVSRRTVQEELRLGKAWLRRYLSDEKGGDVPSQD